MKDWLVMGGKEAEKGEAVGAAKRRKTGNSMVSGFRGNLGAPQILAGSSL